MKGGARRPRRPPVKKVSVAKVKRKLIVRPRAAFRPEGIRWVRADGTPNWRQWIPPREGEVAYTSSHPAITIAPQSTIMEAVEAIAEHQVRGLVVADPAKGQLRGLLTAMDLVNYLGGGEYYGIIVNRHKNNIYSALRNEYVDSISNPTPLFIPRTESLDAVIRLMVENAVGIVPVVYEDGSVYGVITEHDITKHVAGKRLGVTVGQIASRNIVTVGIEDTMLEAAKRMVRFGFRRLPVVSEGGESVRGMLNAKDYVSFFGKHTVFKELETMDISEVLKTPVYEIMREGFFTIEESADAGEAAEAMINNNTSSLLVIDEQGEVAGIVTERDILMAILW